MRLQQDGDLEVSLGEIITVEIEATDTAFLAHAGAIQQGQWTSVTNPSPSKEVRQFTATSAFSKNFVFAIGFDFSLGPDGKIPANASYSVQLTSNMPGPPLRPRTIRPTSILPSTRVFTFEVAP